MASARHVIRATREELGLSGRELARRAGKDHTYLSRFERGLLPVEPSPEWLHDVTTALGDALAEAGDDHMQMTVSTGPASAERTLRVIHEKSEGAQA